MADYQDEEMPEEPLLLQRDLTCPVCQAIFVDPVLLPCTHTFCRVCLDRSRERNTKCPVCRQEIERGQEIFNRTLGDACESFLKEKNLRPQNRRAPEQACNLHLKPLDLYCEKDEEPVCADCVSLHCTHKLLTLRDGAQRCKEELGWKVKIFETKLQSHEKMIRKLNSSMEYIKCQATQAKSQIKAEFERIRQVLTAEEDQRLHTLSAEEEQKTKAIQELIDRTNKEIGEIKKLTETVKKEMGNEDLPLVRNFQDLKRKAQWTHEDPRFPDNSLLNMGRHVGALSFKIWKNMQAHIQYNPVVLDQNTASPFLSLNADLTAMKESSEQEPVPDNPERFHPCVFVLGAEGYTSGKHRWDIMVGDNPKWVVGVCKESVPRKKKFTVCPNRGVWAIALSKGVYTALTNERKELPVQERPERIRIKLDIDKGEVSFWDSGMAKHLVTLAATFDERIFPIFGPGLHSAPMTLVSGKIAVHTS